MIRPEQHIIDSKADALFREIFAEWGVNGSQRDYGWDYVVEIFRNHQSTGFLFNGQLKGSQSTKYSADGTFISQVLQKDAADYLSRQLRQPTFLFHADVDSRKLFWSAIQLDQKVSTALENGETESLTVRIPTANVLPGDIQPFTLELTRSQTMLVSRILLDTRPIDFAAAMATQPIERLSEVAEDLHEKAFRVELSAAFRQRQENDIEGAMGTLRKVRDAASSSGYVEIHFNAVLQLGELQVLELMQSDKPQALVADKRLEVAHELCSIAKRKPRHLHLFGQITRRAAELSVAVQKTFGLLMIWQAHDRRGDDPLWTAVLWFQLQQSLVAAHQKYNRALRLAQATARSPYRWVASRPIAEIGLPIGTLGKLLRTAGFVQESLRYEESAFDLLRFSAAIATENQSVDELYNAITQAIVLEKNKEGQIFSWIRSVISDWPANRKYRENVEHLLQRATQRMDGVEFEGEIQSSPRRIIYNFLTSAGIDPTSERWARLVDLAVKDDDPTRVLIECHHKTAMPHPFGNPSLVRLGLERANPKILGCALHQYALAGEALDDINAEFKKRYCDACPDKSPRLSGWQFYDEMLNDGGAEGGRSCRD